MLMVTHLRRAHPRECTGNGCYTTVYFIAMAAAVLLWSQYVIAYLDDDGRFAKALHIVCWVLFVIQILAVIVNCFAPIMFWFDEAGGYHAGAARYAVLTLQILMFLLASACTLQKTVSSVGTAKIRHLAIGKTELTLEK